MAQPADDFAEAIKLENTKDDVTGKARRTFYKDCLGIKTFTFFGCILILGMGVQGQYFAGSIRMFEKQFGLSSSQTGVLLGVDNVSGLVMVLVLGYFGDVLNKAKMIAWCTLLSGIFTALMSLPHFISLGHNLLEHNTSANNQTSMEDIMCNYQIENKTYCSKKNVEARVMYGQMAFWIFLILRLLLGISGTSHFNLVLAYIQDNAPKNQSSFLIALANVWIFVTPFVGLSLSGFANSIPLDLKETTLTPQDPRFIGAWWVGFLMVGAFLLLFCIPIFFFPKHLSNYKKPHRLTDEDKKSIVKLMKDLLRALLFLLTSPVFMLFVAAATLAVIGFLGHTVSLLRYIETHFRVPIYIANYTTGIMLSISGVLGSIFGGVILSKWQMSRLTMARFMISMMVISTIAMAVVMLFVCPQLEFEGIKHVSAGNSRVSIMTNCSTSCGCDVSASQPVCGSDGRNYFTPCHAGCTGKYDKKQGSNFSSCDCVPGGSASPGTCAMTCHFLIPYLLITVIFSFCGSLLRIPQVIFTFKLVPKDLQSFALGLSSFASNALAFMPGPTLFGLLVDRTCLLWQEECGHTGSCLLYDTNMLRNVIHGTVMVFGGSAAILGTCGSLLLLKKKYSDEPPESYREGHSSYTITLTEVTSAKKCQVEPL